VFAWSRAGDGGWTPQSAQALQRFAENWKLPVGNAFRFQDTFDNHHPLYPGDVGIGLNPKLAARVKASTLIEVILDPEVITTRATLSSITRGALNKKISK
jgi:thiamine pyrophosphate-dependent acetolactate synthase large subunit-like protein